MRFTLPLILLLPFVSCDRDSGPHFASHYQTWSGALAVIGQHDWLVTAVAIYTPHGPMTVDGQVTAGPPGLTTVFEVMLDNAATSSANVIPLVSWNDPELGAVGVALVRDMGVAWPKALAKDRVALIAHSE